MQQNFKKKTFKTSNFSQFLIFGLGILVSFATIGVSSKSEIPLKSSEPKEEDYSVNLKKNPEIPKYFEPLFGEFLVKKCTNTCIENNSNLVNSCIADCNRFSTQLYAKITKSKAADDAKEVIKRCNEKNVIFPANTPGKKWTVVTNQILDVIAAYPENLSLKNQYPVIKDNYNQIFNAASYLSLPAQFQVTTKPDDELKLISNMATSICLLGNIAISNLAQKELERSNDSLSLKYYKEFADTLNTKLFEVKKDTLPVAKSVIPQCKFSSN
ncbi:MAG: hypothetical protein KBC84_03995 [Proteobacteria bacterium]|nr:hypothetical protein [Pseudomonadota bacterium]